MLPQENRLDLRHETQFFKTAKRQNAQSFQVWWRPSQDTQFAIIVPKKVSKLAVQRNILSRRMKSVLLKAKAQLSQKQLVVIFFPKGKNSSYDQLAKEVQNITHRL